MPLIDLHAAERIAAAGKRTRPIIETPFPKPFPTGLLYGCPAHGIWTIVHMGLLVPESHSIFVCAAGCLRGCSMSAYELGYEHHFSTVTVEDANLLEGDAETVLVEGVSRVIGGLPKKPRAVLVYTSCVHHYMGTDFGWCLRELSGRFPGIDFLDCYMTPITREEMTPDAKMLSQVLKLLKTGPGEKRGVLLAGGLLPLAADCELRLAAEAAGDPLLEAAACRGYDEFQGLSAARLVTSVSPLASAAADIHSTRAGIPWIPAPTAFGDDEIEAVLRKFCSSLGLDPDAAGLASDWERERNEADAALRRAVAGLAAMGASIAVDQTATSRPLAFARRWIETGGRVSGIFADVFNPAERADYEWLRRNAPGIPVASTTGPSGLYRERRALDGSGGPVVALGQRSAWYSGTNHFVNIVAGATDRETLWGWTGLATIAGLIIEAARTESDVKESIASKALGCVFGEAEKC